MFYCYWHLTLSVYCRVCFVWCQCAYLSKPGFSPNIRSDCAGGCSPCTWKLYSIVHQSSFLVFESPHCVALAGLELAMKSRLALTHRDPLVFASRVLGLKGCATMFVSNNLSDLIRIAQTSSFPTDILPWHFICFGMWGIKSLQTLLRIVYLSLQFYSISSWNLRYCNRHHMLFIPVTVILGGFIVFPDLPSNNKFPSSSLTRLTLAYAPL